MKSKSIKKNYIYNLIYQIFALITPLITTPYVSRVLGSSGIGQYSFTYSIATYFTLFAALGFGYYAQREVARFQDNKHEQTIIFWEIFIARFVSVSLSAFIYIILNSFAVFGQLYSTLIWILTINIVATAFDVTFFFQGNEDFGFIAIRNIVVKCIGMISIFIFVKNSSHVWLYALCQSVILIISNLSLWSKLPKLLTKFSLRELNVKRHYLPTLRLFIPTIAVSVYTMLDKTLIGVLIPGSTENLAGEIVKLSDVENGFYEQAEKIVKLSMTIITSLGTVMIPRNANAIASGNIDEFKTNINGALKFVFLIGVPIMFGLAAVACNFSPWFFGPGYEKVPYLIMMFSPLILIIGLSNVLGLQYLIPLKLDKKYTIAVTSGAVINLCLNTFLIRYFWSYGACIATVFAELLILILMLLFSKKDISFFAVVRKSWKPIISGIIMFAAVFLTQFFLKSSIINTLILVCEGIVVYFALLVVFREELLFTMINKFISKVKR